MTLNVYTILNKFQAAEHYLKTNRVLIAVITETHLQEGDATDIQIKGYVLASTCKRRSGEAKGGVAIYVHETIPCNKRENGALTAQHEVEFCSTIVFPNHNKKDQLAIVGVYGPPEKDRPAYEPMLGATLNHHREHRITTVLTGGLNITSWE